MSRSNDFYSNINNTSFSRRNPQGNFENRETEGSLGSVNISQPQQSAVLAFTQLSTPEILSHTPDSFGQILVPFWFTHI